MIVAKNPKDKARTLYNRQPWEIVNLLPKLTEALKKELKF